MRLIPYQQAALIADAGTTRNDNVTSSGGRERTSLCETNNNNKIINRCFVVNIFVDYWAVGSRYCGLYE